MRGWFAAGVDEHLQRDLGSSWKLIVHRQANAHALVGIAPVDHRVGDEVLVRHQRLDAVAVAHHDVAAAQLLHPAEVLGAGAGGAGEADDVAGLDGLVEQQHEAGHEIAGDGLQAEPEAETDGAGEQAEHGEIDARGVDAQQHAEADEEEGGELGDADARRDREALELHDAPFDGARDQAGDDQEADDDHDALEQRPEAERGLAGDAGRCCRACVRAR